MIHGVPYTLDSWIVTKQLDVPVMRERIQAAVAKSGVREEALTPRHCLFAAHGELGGADFKAIARWGERVGTGTVSALLSRGYGASDKPCGSRRFAVPRHALRFYVPALWPQAKQGEVLLQTERGTVAVPRTR